MKSPVAGGGGGGGGCCVVVMGFAADAADAADVNGIATGAIAVMTGSVIGMQSVKSSLAA